MASKNIPDENPVAQRLPLRRQIEAITEKDFVGLTPRVAQRLTEAIVTLLTRIDVMDQDMVKLGSDMILGFVGLSAKIDNLALPPMRRREDSIAVIEETTRTVSETAAKTARDRAKALVDDPNSDLTPTAVQGIVNETVAEALTEALQKQREQDHYRQLEAAQAKAEQTKKERKEFWRLVVTGVIAGLIVLAASLYVTYMQGRNAGHSEGLAETKPTPVPIPVPVVAPTMVPAPPPLPPPSAPAQTVPAGRRNP